MDGIRNRNKIEDYSNALSSMRHIPWLSQDLKTKGGKANNAKINKLMLNKNQKYHLSRCIKNKHMGHI